MAQAPPVLERRPLVFDTIHVSISRVHNNAAAGRAFAFVDMLVVVVVVVIVVDGVGF
jgi:hypothetical protein